MKKIDEQIIKEKEKKGNFTEEDINKERNYFKLNSQKFLLDFEKLKPRQSKESKFKFEIISYIEDYFELKNN